jgi:hypothetical protein
MGGVYNVINLHTYHYAGNNPLKYTDPDGRMSEDEEEEMIYGALASLRENSSVIKEITQDIKDFVNETKETIEAINDDLKEEGIDILERKIALNLSDDVTAVIQFDGGISTDKATIGINQELDLRVEDNIHLSANTTMSLSSSVDTFSVEIFEFKKPIPYPDFRDVQFSAGFSVFVRFSF